MSANKTPFAVGQRVAHANGSIGHVTNEHVDNDALTAIEAALIEKHGWEPPNPKEE